MPGYLRLEAVEGKEGTAQFVWVEDVKALILF